jgi:hypothetical protein
MTQWLSVDIKGDLSGLPSGGASLLLATMPQHLLLTSSLL